MTISEVKQIPMRELMEWNVFLCLTEEDKPDESKDVVTDLMNIFGGPRG